MARGRSILDTSNVAELAVGAIHLSAAEFDLQIVTHGISGELRKAIPCPCVRIDTRSPRIDCKACRGMGVTYPERMREPVIFLDTQRSRTFKLEAIGELSAGTIQITLPSGILPGKGDMLLPDGEQHVVEEMLWREGSRRVSNDMLRPFRTSPDQLQVAQLPRRERLLYPEPCCVEHVAYIGADGQLVDVRPAHYHIDRDGRWTWRDGHGPEPGAAWSVRYRAPAAYVIHTTGPAWRSEADERMPHRCTAVRFDRVKPDELTA